jgi:hypothetical protein
MENGKRRRDSERRLGEFGKFRKEFEVLQRTESELNGSEFR